MRITPALSPHRQSTISHISPKAIWTEKTTISPINNIASFERKKLFKISMKRNIHVSSEAFAGL